MKKFLFAFVLIFLPLATLAQPLKGEVTFDWLSKSQLEINENINEIRNTIFTDDVVRKYSKKDFRQQYKDKLKNPNNLMDYEDISQGKTEDAEKNYCGFYWKKYLVAYGIQYKNNPTENLYYDALGRLKWVDKYAGNYPNFPYWSYQYDINGKLAAVYYFVSEEDQYVYLPNGTFQGRWFKDKMYNRKAKVVLTRSNTGK